MSFNIVCYHHTVMEVIFYGKTFSHSHSLGWLEAVRHWRDQAASLSGNLQNDLAKQTPSSLCMAHPQSGLLRWLCIGNNGDARLDDGWHSPLHHSPESASTQYDGGNALATIGKRSPDPIAVVECAVASVGTPALSDGAATWREWFPARILE